MKEGSKCMFRGLPGPFAFFLSVCGSSVEELKAKKDVEGLIRKL